MKASPLCSFALLMAGVVGGVAQQAPALTPGTAEMQQQIQNVASQLAQTRTQLEQAQREMERLQAELTALQQKMAVAPPPPASPSLADVQEQQQVLAAEIKLHEQTKVESVSKYPVRLTGLILMNTFLNRGTVDQIDAATVALRPVAGAGNSSLGAGFRQTILGLEASGPHVAGARTSAEVNIDFFGGLPYASYGTSAGYVRLRTASVNLDWAHDALELGFTGPLISPLSPTSYASVAEPALAWAGNLWTWAPQVRYEHRFNVTAQHHVGVELGLWDAPSSGYNYYAVSRTPSPGELSGQPAYEGRISYASDAESQIMQFGIGGYIGRESFTGFTDQTMYALTTDWRLPFARRFEWSGEAYRGRGLGGLGGGVYKDVISGIDAVTGLANIRSLNAAGGWTQIKTRYSSTLEANAALGFDGGFARDFHAIVQPSAATANQLRARNRMVTANFIFSPKTYLVLSPEFRRIWTWPIAGAASTANIFTLSAAYRF